MQLLVVAEIKRPDTGQFEELGGFSFKKIHSRFELSKNLSDLVKFHEA